MTGLLLAGAANAGAIYDPLHGVCNGSGVGTCIDNGTNTPLGNSTAFGFEISPGPQTGDLTIVALIPNNDSVTLGNLVETSPIAQTVSFAAVSGTWTTGTLATFLGISASPDNGIDAFLPTTNFYDSGATGFKVYTADIGTLTISKTGSGGGSPTFNMVSGLPLGAYLVGFCSDLSNPGGDCTVGSKTSTTEVATANSGALLVDGRTPPPEVPEPTTLALFAAGLGGLGFALRRRQTL
jgi:hypothetical protein